MRMKPIQRAVCSDLLRTLIRLSETNLKYLEKHVYVACVECHKCLLSKDFGTKHTYTLIMCIMCILLMFQFVLKRAGYSKDIHK